MSDTAPAAEAASNNPAVDTTTKDSVDEKPAAKAEASADAAMEDATEGAKPATSEEKANGAGKADKTEESSLDKSDKSDKKASNGDRNHHKGRRGTYQNSRGGRRPHDPMSKHTTRNEEFDDLPESSDPTEIRTQVEFYFADHNLSNDEFLFKQTEGPGNKPFPIKQLHTFKRMRHFQPYSAVVDALCDSDVLEVVDKDKTGEEMVKRKKALVAPKDVRDEKRAPFVWELYNRCSAASWKSKLGRSAYAKGFNGSEEKGNVKDVSQVNLELFFKPFGCVSVRKRRDDEGIYKGSVFVEFESEDSLKQFLELDPKPKYQGNELLTMSKSGYNEMKCKEKGIVPGWQRNRGNDGSHENSRDRGGHGGRSRGRGRGRGRGSGDYNNRSHDDRRRRERSNSRGSNEEGKKNWKERRDNFQKNRGGRSGRDDGESRKSPERDVQGVPVIKDTRTKEEKAAAKNRKAEADGDKADVEGSESKKRKADDDGRTDAPKKKIEIREDA